MPLADKIQQDMALNLSELAAASGWNRGTLAAMNLPLIAGKIPYSDFRRILRRRQNAIEGPSVNPSVSSTLAVDRHSQAVVDKFRAPKSRHAQPVS